MIFRYLLRGTHPNCEFRERRISTCRTTAEHGLGRRREREREREKERERERERKERESYDVILRRY